MLSRHVQANCGILAWLFRLLPTIYVPCILWAVIGEGRPYLCGHHHKTTNRAASLHPRRLVMQRFELRGVKTLDVD